MDRQDLQHFMRESSAKVRANLCTKICADYNDNLYNQRETELALEILRLLLRDTSIRVRRALSEAIQHNPEVPHDIIASLAEDHELVAEAVLGSSPVLNEDDLLAIAQSTQSLRKLMAIAGRDTVSTSLTNTLIDRGEHAVTMKVISNNGVQLDDDAFSYILEEYYQDDSILEALVYRSNLPYSVASKLFYLVSNHLAEKLNEQYGLRREAVESLKNASSEKTMLGFLSPWMGQQDIQQLVQELHRRDQLTDSLIMRSLCIGDLRFFQTAMAKRANVSVSNAKILLLDPNGVGFDACYHKAGMPEGLRDAVRCLYQYALEETQLGRYFHDQFTERVLERIVHEKKDQSVEHMPALIAMLGNSVRQATNVH